MLFRAGVAGAAVALMAFFACAGALARTAARDAATCSVGSGEGYGYTYLTSLSVSHTSCATGISLVRHKGKLSGWRCAKKVLDTSPVQYDARMTCTKSSGRVVYTFTQNT